MSDPKKIAKVIVYVLLSGWTIGANAQDGESIPSERISTSPVEASRGERPILDEARAAPMDSAALELSLSISPSLQLSLGGIAGLGGLGSLGTLGIAPTLGIGFAVDRSIILYTGVSGSFYDGGRIQSAGIGIPLSVLVYLEPPRVGGLLPTLRAGVSFDYTYLAPVNSDSNEKLGLAALVTGGLTWLPIHAIAIRGEIGLTGGALLGHDGAESVVAANVGLRADVGIVMRL